MIGLLGTEREEVAGADSGIVGDTAVVGGERGLGGGGEVGDIAVMVAACEVFVEDRIVGGGAVFVDWGSLNVEVYGGGAVVVGWALGARTIAGVCTFAAVGGGVGVGGHDDVAENTCVVKGSAVR